MKQYPENGFLKDNNFAHLFRKLLELQGIDPDVFHENAVGLLKNKNLSTVRVEISGNGNTYPITPGRLVLVADYSGQMKNSEEGARLLSGELSASTGLTFNDSVYFGDEKQPMYSAYALGSRNSGDGKDNDCLLVVVKGSKLEERV